MTGGGNFWRGRTSETIDRTKADTDRHACDRDELHLCIGYFQTCGHEDGSIHPVCMRCIYIPLSKDAAVAALEEGKVIFFAGGTGHPYFSTDTGAVLRAIEIEADAMLLAKAIDGIYDSDPKVNPAAVKYDEVSIQEVIDKSLPQ